MKKIELGQRTTRTAIRNLPEQGTMRRLSADELGVVGGGLVCTTQYHDGTNDDASQTCTSDIYFDNKC